jgi:hypothetical protein
MKHTQPFTRSDATGFWIIWNPKASMPSTKMYFTPDQARAVARKMAEEFPGQSFYVMHTEGVAWKPATPVDTYTPL